MKGSTFHPGRQLRTAVHGDEFVTEGLAKGMAWMDGKFREAFQLKTQVLGPDSGRVQELTILNRVI